MKKTSQIRIAKTLFTIEDDAYSSLDAYLQTVKEHFAASADKTEIIEDIEARIAEQFLNSHDEVITLPLVERIIKEMGCVEDFDDEQVTNAAAAQPRKRRLYRDSEREFIAGVCAGLASFFGLNIVLVRLIFFFFTLFHGIGALVYIVLWITIPAAKTASQRLEMLGEPVTLATLRESAQRAHEDRGVGQFVARVSAFVITLIQYCIGVWLILFAAGSAVALLLASGFLLPSGVWSRMGVPMNVLLPGAEYWVVLIAAIIAALIPLFFLLIAGIALLSQHFVISLRIALVLVGFWFVVLIICGFGAAESLTHYKHYPAQWHETTASSTTTSFQQ